MSVVAMVGEQKELQKRNWLKGGICVHLRAAGSKFWVGILPATSEHYAHFMST